MKLHITKAHLPSLDQSPETLRDIYVADGKIIAFDQPPSGGFTPENVMDANGLWVLPGLVDCCTRLQTPPRLGQLHLPRAELKSTPLQSVLAKAAASGITSLACMPDTSPVLDMTFLTQWIQSHHSNELLPRILPLGALTLGLAGKQLSDMLSLQAAGCVGLSQAGFPVHDTRLLRSALKYAATRNIKVFVCARDDYLDQDTCGHEGVVATRLGVPTSPPLSEALVVMRYIMLAKDAGASLHFSSLSSSEALELIERARQEGMDITCDVPIANLFLTEVDTSHFNSACHLHPPLRTQSDRSLLRQAVCDGRINAISSNHVPVSMQLKNKPFTESYPGAQTHEALLPLTLQLAREQNRDISDVLSRVTSSPAEILQHPETTGQLVIGQSADMCFFNPNRLWRPQDIRGFDHRFVSPFANWQMEGEVTCTLLSGKIIYSLQP